VRHERMDSAAGALEREGLWDMVGADPRALERLAVEACGVLDGNALSAGRREAARIGADELDLIAREAGGARAIDARAVDRTYERPT
jgi:hypothetical protein